MKTVNICIIGAGWIVVHMHIPALQKIDHVRIVAICDTDIERAKKVAEEYNIPNVCEKIDELLEYDIDAVIIATPNYTHAMYSIRMLECGIHVLCEKPVALHASEIERIKKLEKERNVVYCPGFVNRWRFDIQQIYAMISDNRIGNILSIEAGWLRKNGVPRPGTWFTKREYSGGGVLVDLGSHVIDICLMLLKDKVVSQYQLLTAMNQDTINKNSGAASWFAYSYNDSYEIDVEDTAYADVFYEDGTKLSVKLSWLSPIKGDCTYFDIVGDKGRIRLHTLFGMSNDRLWSDDTLQIQVGDKVEIQKLDRIENSTAVAFSKMHQYFIKSIAEKQEYTNSDDALITVRMIENLYSAEKVDNDAISKISLEEITKE